MRADEKFRIGECVRLTDEARRHFGPSDVVLTTPVAVVHGFARDGVCVRVMRSERHTIENFHMDFWDPLPADYFDRWAVQGS